MGSQRTCRMFELPKPIRAHTFYVSWESFLFGHRLLSLLFHARKKATVLRGLNQNEIIASKLQHYFSMLAY